MALFGLNWQRGRSGNYQKMRLAKSGWPIPSDCYLIRYREGDFAAVHTDPSPKGMRHFRLNILLQRAQDGGNFTLWGASTWRKGRIRLFRPDLHQHAVTKIIKGQRLVLSIGWLSKEREEV